jgi:ribosomal protein S18 acetylase RimI-like enzyme
VIRTASPEEAPAIAELHLRTAIAGYGHIFPPEAEVPTIAALLADWAAWLADPARSAFVADGGDQLLGVVLAGPDDDDASLGHVARLYVDARRWGEGLGRRLYDAAVGHCAAAGFDEATLWVLEANDRARSWYERLGWRPTGERKVVYGPAGIVDLQYRVTLGSAATPSRREA